MLTYDWYEGSRKLGPDDDFEPGKCYTAQVEVKSVEGAKFDSSDKLSMGLNHDRGTQDIPFTRVSDKLLCTEIHLLFKPVLTMALHPGDALPTAADLNKQLPVGYTVTTLTWADGATTAPGDATEMTITELKISGTENRCQITGGAVVINGTAYPASDSYFNTLTLTNITVPVKAKGVEVRGTVKSYGDAGENVTVTLTKQGETGTAFTDTLTGASGSAPYSQSYAFSAVPAGDYTLKVEKKGHAPFTKEITVGDSNVTENVTVYLIGDVNRDGKIDADDVTALLRHVSGIEMLSSSAVALGNVNGDSNIDADDVTKLLRYVSGIIPNLN